MNRQSAKRNRRPEWRMLLASIAAAWLLAACQPAPAGSTPDPVATQVAALQAAAGTLTAAAPLVPSPDLVATHVVAMRSAAGTLTAEAPTPTTTATPSPAPTATPAPSDTPTQEPTETPTATATPVPIATATRQALPAPTSQPVVTSAPTAALALAVSYRDFHYECQKTLWQPKDEPKPVFGYRSFQALMEIRNNSTLMVDSPWKPTRWIVAHWRRPDETRILDRVWEWVARGKDWQEPPIAPGGVGRWTYIAFPLERWEYVKAAEFDWNGQTYRFEFPRPEFAGVYNFVDCSDYPGAHKPKWGDPADVTRPTP